MQPRGHHRLVHEFDEHALDIWEADRKVAHIQPLGRLPLLGLRWRCRLLQLQPTRVSMCVCVCVCVCARARARARLCARVRVAC